MTLKTNVINLFMQELFANEQFTGKQFLRVKIERRITILCEEHFHIGPQVHKMDRSISKLLEARVKAEGLDGFCVISMNIRMQRFIRKT